MNRAVPDPLPLRLAWQGASDWRHALVVHLALLVQVYKVQPYLDTQFKERIVQINEHSRYSQTVIEQ